MVGAGRQHLSFTGVLHGVDDDLASSAFRWKQQLGLNETEFGISPPPGADRLAGARAAEHLDRPLWRARGGWVLLILSHRAAHLSMGIIPTACWHFLAIGLFCQPWPGSFKLGTRRGAVGKRRGANARALVNKFPLIAAGGWMQLPKVYAVCW